MQQQKALSLVLLLAVSASSVYGYTCSPDTCKLPECFCAGQVPPGGLQASQIPQFILLTHDDATDAVAHKAIESVTTGIFNPNQCPIPATFFTMQGQTTCEDVQWAHKAGHEIASHTVNHLYLTPGFKEVESEILGARDFLINECNLTDNDVVGFRSPYLINNPGIRQVLSANKFMYDSTINEHWPMPTSLDGARRLWPYTMDNGIPQDCAWTSNVCVPTEKYAGLWEVPVWVLQGANYPNGAYAMDPEGDVYDLLMQNFMASYNGNRAPVPIFVHSPWLQDMKHVDDVRAFLADVLKKYTDVYVVSMRQLIEYMKAPVAKEQFGEWLGCLPGGQAAGAKSTTAAAAAAPTPAAAGPVAEAPAAAAPGSVTCQDTSCGGTTADQPIVNGQAAVAGAVVANSTAPPAAPVSSASKSVVVVAMTLCSLVACLL